MKKILLLSDKSSYIDDLLIHSAEHAVKIWHAGDIGSIEISDKLKAPGKPLIAVYGNIDNTEIRKEFPLNQRWMCEGVDVWITHIGGYPKKYSPAVRDEIRQNPPKLFICGHSHILKVMMDKDLGLLHMNPGAAGKHGWHKQRTMLRFVIDGENIKDLEVIKLAGK